MGFELEHFESPVDPEFLCKLCGKVLEEPLTTPCGHVFCAGCVIPWVAKWSSCPAKCRRISAAELNRVLALKNLVLKLAVRCHNRPLGCSRVLELRQLPEHAAVCGFSTDNSEMKSGLKDVEVRGVTVNIRGMSELRGEREARRRAEGSSTREKRLQLAQLHRQLREAALRNQREFEELRRRTESRHNSCGSPVNTEKETRRLTVTLHRGSGSLGFNIVGGRSCEELEASDGIYVSKIEENGPAERGGLQIHDRIIKVNNKDLSLATHDDAVEAFLKARDPIEVAVLRRVAPTKTSNTLLPDTRGVSTTTQTEITLEHVEAMEKLTSSTSSVGMKMMDKHTYMPTESEVLSYSSLYPTGFFEGMPKDPGRGELEYEEVDLQRTSTQDKLGLTLCYKTDDEEETGIYVSEIDSGSIAAQDGRVREGDQIIQINGVDIQNHEEAVAVLAKGNCRNVRLLLARPEIQDDGWLEEDEHSFLEDLQMETPEQQHCQAMHFTASMLRQREREEDEGTTDTATVLSNPHEKDSGVGRTDESTRNDESSEQENLADDHTSTSDTLLSSGNRFSCSGHVHFSNESFLSADGGEFSSIPEVECERFRELLELKCLMNETSPEMVFGESARSFGKRISMDCDEQEIEMLNEELRKIELECLSIIRSHRLQQEIQRQQASRDSREQNSRTDRTSRGEGQKMYSITTDQMILEQMDKDSSSAYNTGESCRSSSLTLELSSDASLCKRTQDAIRGAISTYRKKPATESTMLSPIQETSPTKNQSSFPMIDATKKGKEKEQGKDIIASPLSPSKHKHIANIPAHAQHYQSYMQLVQQKSAVEFGQSEVSLVSLCQNHQSSSINPKPSMEWKVKIRSDGTRYITKRPAKEQLLRERAFRIREERRGMTTDDDTVSELKMGRYWSKEERKQHAIRAKEQRQRREFMKQSRVACTNEEGQADDIVQLSHRKMMKKRNKKILDSWMTIQELLTHGAKSPDGTQLYNPLLSVTTV